jgi:hypothetical protein
VRAQILQHLLARVAAAVLEVVDLGQRILVLAGAEFGITDRRLPLRAGRLGGLRLVDRLEDARVERRP